MMLDIVLKSFEIFYYNYVEKNIIGGVFCIIVLI